VLTIFNSKVFAGQIRFFLNLLNKKVEWRIVVASSEGTNVLLQNKRDQVYFNTVYLLLFCVCTICKGEIISTSLAVVHLYRASLKKENLICK